MGKQQTDYQTQTKSNLVDMLTRLVKYYTRNAKRLKTETERM